MYGSGQNIARHHLKEGKVWNSSTTVHSRKEIEQSSAEVHSAEPVSGGRRVRIGSTTVRNRQGIEESQAPIAAGAQAGLPAIGLSPSLLIASCMSWRLTYLVSTSAGFSVPRILTRSSLRLRTLSWIQRSVVARCLTLPKPFLRQIPIAAVASECTRIWMVQPRSFKRLCMPKAWAAP